ncbi:MAG TPA: hypothetical protein VK530_00750, partial [Candidatus Acidoferrum sp.]|nr:hypothetical protein [Candidatus Acidoferrum sp.]
MSSPETKMKSEARSWFRVLAGLLAALMLCFGVPLGIYLGISGSAVGWLMTPPLLVVGMGFAAVARTGRWFVSAREHDHPDAS